MLITLSGPRGVGKSTSARITRLALPEILVVAGDDYVFENDSHLVELKAEIDRCLDSGAAVLLEHITACHLAQSLDFAPDISIFLLPEAPLEERDASDFLSQISASIHEMQQMGAGAKEVCRVNSIKDAVAQIVSSHAFSKNSRQVDTFVFKVASRCNLGCDYCYMYEAFDQEWRYQPTQIDLRVARQAAKRIRDYSDTFEKPRRLSIVLHGGEPLTLPISHLCDIIDVISEEFEEGFQFDLGMQTNGVLLDKRRLKLLDDRGVNIGLSLDGGSEQANARRPFLSGESSWRRSQQALDLLTSFEFTNGSFGGLLSVSGTQDRGSEYYRFLKTEGVRKADILLMGGTSEKVRSHDDVTKDLIFLTDIFECWIADDDPASIRLFESIINRLTGLSWNVDSLGFAPPGLLGINASGDWEFLDCLRLSSDDAWQSGLSVFTSSVGEVVSSDKFRELTANRYDYARTCVECDVFDVCGGGYLPHRYRKANGFANPSQNCDALYGIISHIKQNVLSELSSE